MAKIKFLIMPAALWFALFALSACTTIATNNKVDTGETLSPDARLYADYVSASYAYNLGDAAGRSSYYSKAFARRPQDLDLGRKAMAAAINNGDTGLSRALAIELIALEPTDGVARAILGAQALGKGRYKKTISILDNASAGIGVEDFNSMMRGWAEYGLGNKAGAIAVFDNMQGGRYFEFLGKLQRAIINIDLDNLEMAEKDFAEIDEVNLAPIESTLAQVRGLMLRGDKDKALAKLKKYADENNGSLTGPIRAYINTIEGGKKFKWQLTPAQLASRAMTEPAFRYYGAQQQFHSAETFLRLALVLDPHNDKARLFLGSVLEEIDRNDAALQAYGEIPQRSEYSVSARLSEADILFGDDKNAEGLAVLESIQASHPSRVTRGSLGRAYLIMEDYAKALPYYEALIEEMSADELEKNPMPHYLRGIILERLDRWQEAVPDFEFVLKHKPDDADALNYLGYTWVDKGVNLTRAFEMIEKAVELEPKSGAIIDSLGWAHYKLGRYGLARIKLEEAAERSPTSATIIDHLGDVYWKLGRRKEAGYQWARAAELDPTEEELATIKIKLKDGLDAVASPE
ncbi:MAG: tetratricopeptide repeat protein [Robiginitomaculum sp.]|nr:tetratricopeptide repeat protein [Robiginitomaculum sp.]